jgi:hypothetical protein
LVTNLLALHGIALSRDGLHPLLVLHFQRRLAIARDPRVVSLAERRGDDVRQAGPFPGSIRDGADVPAGGAGDGALRREDVSDEHTI